MRWPWQKKVEQKDAQFETVLRRLIAAQDGSLTSIVTPDTCMQSPTVHAIVTAVSRRLSVTPVHVFKKTDSPSGATKERLPNHPVARLLRKPNAWQSGQEFWQDAASVLMRWGRFHSFKGRGKTGPILELIPLSPQQVSPVQDSDWRVSFRVTVPGGGTRDFEPSQLFNARGPARDFVKGDSPVEDVAQAIALEILAEKFGWSFFKNGALPLLIFRFMEGSAGFESKEQEKAFIDSFQEAFSGNKTHRGMVLPKGFDKPEPVAIDHDRSQFLETRKYQRTVIAGAFGVPPHLVGDLERATFNNVEQQDQDFTQNVVYPVAKAFESAMERDLLTDSDRRDNICVRFNLDSTLRADFKSRQEGLWRQYQSGVINSNEWREIEGRNPRDGGDEYVHPGNMVVDGEEPDETNNNDPA